MKVSPVSQPTGQPGQVLGSVEVGKTASPLKLERARAIARGEKVEDLPQSGDPQADRVQRDVRKLKMRTNFSTNREEPVEEIVAAVAPQNTSGEKHSSFSPESPPQDLSSTPTSNEPGAIEETKPLSPQFAALAKQKRALQLEKAEFEKQKAEIMGRGDASELIAKLKSNPLSVLQEHGVTYDQLTEAILNGPQEDPRIRDLEAKLAALEKGVDTKFQTREQQQEEAALTEMLFEAESLGKEGDTYELIRSQDAYDQVLRLIHSTYKQTGRVLDVTEAMERVETKLMADAERLASINKVRAKIAPPPITTLQPQQKTGMRTLTARDSAVPQLSARARAIAAFNGTLKK